MKFFKPVLEEYKQENSEYTGYSISCYDNNFLLLNFSPGPAPISSNVLDALNKDIFSNTNYVYGNTPLEMSHRSPEFSNILQNVNSKIISFMNIPDDFKIIWTQAGGHGQFSAIPLNMRTIDGFNKAIYIVNGTWSSRAYNESKKFINSENLLEHFYDTQVLEYNTMPQELDIPENIDYVYLCSNETVNGIEFKNKYLTREELKGSKLLVDMSSDFLMKKIDWTNIDVAFACTSKNMGVAGANIVIIRKNLLNELNFNNDIPCVLDWKLYNNSNSLYNTPAVFNIYLLEKILDNYVNEMKNIENVQKISCEKATLFYNFLDNNKLFFPVVKDKNYRSNINIPFIVGNGDSIIMSKFLEYCYFNNIVGLRTLTPFSYKSLGLIEPLRVSLYNGISINDVKQLILVMENFLA